jgi:hypothetical protein
MKNIKLTFVVSMMLFCATLSPCLGMEGGASSSGLSDVYSGSSSVDVLSGSENNFACFGNIISPLWPITDKIFRYLIDWNVISPDKRFIAFMSRVSSSDPLRIFIYRREPWQLVGYFPCAHCDKDLVFSPDCTKVLIYKTAEDIVVCDFIYRDPDNKLRELFNLTLHDVADIKFFAGGRLLEVHHVGNRHLAYYDATTGNKVGFSISFE